MLKKLIHQDLQIWIRRGVPKRKATYKDVLDGVKNQAISASLLLAAKPLWDLAAKTQLSIGVFLNSLLVGVFVFGALCLLAMSIYQTMYAVAQASLFNVPKHRRQKGRPYLFALIIWVVSFSFSIVYAGIILCIVQFSPPPH